LLTFKAQISSLVVESIYSKLFADKVFTFSKRRIFFTETQLDTYKFNLGDCRLLHQTEYSLKTIYDKNDKLQYQITVGQNCHGILKLNWLNLLKLKIIHDLLKLPNWLKKLLDKLLDKGVDAIIVIAIALISYKLGISNGQQATKSDQPTTIQQNDTAVSLKAVLHNDTGNSYNNIDTFRSFPFYTFKTKTK